MQLVDLDVFAKINWSLGVLGVLENGYHELDMLLQSVSLRDSLIIKSSDGLQLTVGGRLPQNPEKNLCIKAARAFFEYTHMQGGCEISLTKRIPICAGMGGGSADAAGVLIGLNMLYGTKLKKDELAQIGVGLGADVPFMLTGGLMRARGIGEQLQGQKIGKRMYLVVLMPRRGASTANVFAEFDAMATPPAVDTDAICDALLKGDARAVASNMANHLQTVTAMQNPDIDKAIAMLMQSGAAGAMMTGSGSACYGLYVDKQSADNAFNSLIKNKDGFRVYKVHTVHSSFALNRIC